MSDPVLEGVMQHLEEHREAAEKMLSTLVLTLIVNAKSMEESGFEPPCIAFILDTASVALAKIALAHYSKEAAPIVAAVGARLKAGMDDQAEALAKLRDLRPTQAPGKA